MTKRSFCTVDSLGRPNDFVTPTTATVNKTICGLGDGGKRGFFQLYIADLQDCPKMLSDCEAVGEPESQRNCRECCKVDTSEYITIVIHWSVENQLDLERIKERSHQTIFYCFFIIIIIIVKKKKKNFYFYYYLEVNTSLRQQCF